MFSRFLAKYKADQDATGPVPSWTETDTLRIVGTACPAFTKFMRENVRSSYDDGLLRFFLPTTDPSIDHWNRPDGWLGEWPGLGDKVSIFACDWLGRQIGFHRGRLASNGEPMISMFDPGGGDVRESDATFLDLIATELVVYPDDYLAPGFFAKWRAVGGEAPRFGQCVGYRRPLFVGGEDAVENLQHWKRMEVYADMHGQLFKKVS